MKSIAQEERLRIFILLLPFVVACAAMGIHKTHTPDTDSATQAANAAQDAANAAANAAQMHQHHVPPPSFP